MTSTTDIAKLIEANTKLKDYFEGARGEINTRLNLAEQRVGDTKRYIYIDQANGSDANDGTINHPIASFDEAANRMVSGGVSVLTLLTDYEVDTYVRFPTSSVIIRNQYGTTGDPKLSFAGSVAGDASKPTGFAFTDRGICSLAFQHVRLELGTSGSGVSSSFNVITPLGFTAVSLSGVTMLVPAGSNQNLIHPSWAYTLNTYAITVPSEMAGRWITGVSAGTDTSTISQLASTNLSTV